jgi:hypothetical protein
LDTINILSSIANREQALGALPSISFEGRLLT